MKLFSKKKKNIFLSIVCFFLLSYFMINYFKLNVNFVIVDDNVQKNNLAFATKKETRQEIELPDPNDATDKSLPIILPPPLNPNNDQADKINLNLNEKSVNEGISKIITAPSTLMSQKRRFYAVDGNGLGSVNTGVTKCDEEIEIELTNDLGRADFSYFLNSVPSLDFHNQDDENRKHYYMVYAMESEPHSGGGETWTNADFRMWYNLDLSYPEPATYFDIKSFLPDLLAAPTVEFENKETSANICWILSNCAAFNGRENYVRNLMALMAVDSYGGCLRNKNTHTGARMQGNIELYSKYKFVIAIENSNCEDYVTEKLVHAVASGSIPIVAGRDGKPNYLKFMPKNSYINVYDFKTIKELVEHVKAIATDKKLYDKYMYFRKNHNYTKKYMLSLPLPKLIDLAKTIIDPIENSMFFNGLIDKEKSENKLCKIARYLKNTPKDVLHKEIKSRRMNRPSTSKACLTPGNLGQDFT